MLEKSGFICRQLLSNGLDVATLNRLFLDKALPDESLQGDLLKGFFVKREL